MRTHGTQRAKIRLQMVAFTFSGLFGKVGVHGVATVVFVLRVNNQQFIGSGLPFIVTAPLNSKCNVGSKLTSSVSCL